MAEIRSRLIVELPVAQVYNGTEIFPIQQDGVTRKTNSQDIIDYTKIQDYATWVYGASSNLLTKSLTSGYITMIVNPENNNDKPEFFIGESSFTENLQLTGLSGFKFFYDEIKDNFVFVRSISSISAVRVLTAYYIDQNAYTYINNLSTSNTLSARNIFTTNNITISTTNTEGALFISQKGNGYALKISDELNDSTPFIVDSNGNVSIKTNDVRADLTISGDVSARGSLSSSNVFVFGKVGVGTNTPNEIMTINGNVSSNSYIYDRDGNSINWNSGYSTWNASSALHLSTTTTVRNNSANWQSVYSHWNSTSAFELRARTFVGNNSADIVAIPTTYLKAAGGVISNNLNISGAVEIGSNLVLRGSLTAYGPIVNVNPTLIQQSATSLTIDTSATIGQKLVVGNELITRNLFVTNNAIITGTIVSNTSITAPVVYGGSGNSNNWNTASTEVLNNRNNWNSVYSDWNTVSTFDLGARTFVGNNSANILQGTSTWNNVSAFHLESRTFVGNNSANIRSVYSNVNANSAAWENIDIVYPDWVAHGNILKSAATFTGNNSANQLSIFSTTRTNSASWGTGGSYGSVYSSNSGTYLTNLSGDARYVRINNFPSLEYLPLSGGTMTGAMTVNQPIYINYAGRTGNSTDWDNASDYYSLCSQRISEGVTFIFVNSGNLIPTRVRELSSNWNSVFSTVCATSASARGTVNLTTGQTTVNVNSYRVGALDVFLNGVKLVNGTDFTATNGSTIVLAEAAKNNSYVLDYVSYGVFNVPNAVLKTGDTMSGTLTVPQLNVTNRYVDADIVGNTSGVHVGNVNGFGNNFVRTGQLLSTNLTVTGGAVFSVPSNTTTDVPLRIINQGIGNSFYVSDSTTIDSTPFVINNDGDVGIGTSSPQSKLDVVGDALGNVLNNETVLARFISNNSNVNQLKIFQFRNANGTTWDTATTRIQNITDISVQSYIDFNPQGNQWGIALGTNTQEVLTITNANKVGIDTKNPTENLHVDGNVRVTSGSLSVSGNISGQVFYGDGSGLTDLDGRTAFLKFPNDENYHGGGRLYNSSFFISKYNIVFVAGYNANEYNYGMGDNVGYVDQGFREIPINFDFNGEYVQQFYASHGSAYVLTNLGNLYSIGRNNNGQLGLNDQVNRITWERITYITNVSYFCVCNSSADYGIAHCFAISNGSLYAWGYNTYGNLGLNNTSNIYNQPTLVNQGSILNKTIIKAYACKCDYTNYSWSFVIDSNNELHACGYNGAYQLGFPDSIDRIQFTRVANAVNADSVNSSGYNTRFSSFVLRNKNIYSCGNNTNGQHLTGNTTAKTGGFTQINIPDINGKVEKLYQAHENGGTILVVLTDNTIRTWGDNTSGIVGDGSTTDRISTPYNPGISNVVKVTIAGSIDGAIFYVLTSSGDIYASGYNGHGQKGIGSTTNNNRFVKMIKPSYIKFKDIGPSSQSNLCGVIAADQYGKLWACGYNEHHSLGITNDVQFPGQVRILTRCNIF